MFKNPNTLWIEIIVLVSAVVFVSVILGRYIYKRIHHIPTGECACCKGSKNSIVKEYHKTYSK